MDVYDFGKRLQRMRKKKKLSQSEVAKRLNVHRQTISSYERNNVTPSYEVLRQMAIMYETSLDYLAGLSDRKSFYFGNFTPSQQELILDLLKKLEVEFNKNNR